jgi:hypothetical protein
MKKEDFLNNIKFKVTELEESASVGSVLGDPGSPTYGGFIGPLGRISKRKLNSRLFSTWGDSSVKNGSGKGRIVEPPQGHVKEHIYSVEGEMVTEGNLLEWFGGDLKQKPAFDGGKLVTIEPKCLAFPYCSQGAIDKPIKLIGETKEHMCESCYGYCSHIAEETGKSPEYIAKLIREKYLSENSNLESVYEPAKPIAEIKPIVHQLDESIELQKEIINNNNIENTNTMENIQMTPELASKCMEGIMKNNELAECMYETLVSEGFLSESLEEGDTYENQCTGMMEDAEICMEMVKACGMNESDCAKKVNEGIRSFFYGDPMDEFKTFLRKIGKDESIADAIANEDDINVKQAMFLSAIGNDESNFVGKVGTRAKDIKHALGLIDIETRDANRGIGAMHKSFNNEGMEMEEGEGINPAIYDQLKDCIEKGHSYEEAKQHVADAVDGWDLSMEDYSEAKKQFGKDHRDGVELEEGEGEGSRYMFFSNLEQIKNQAEKLLSLDHDRIEAMLNSGHDWAADHIATSKETLDHAFDFITNEMEDNNEPEGEQLPVAVGPVGPEGPTDELMEYNDEADVEDDVEVKSDSQQYEKEIKLVTQYMNDIERALNKVGAALSSEDIKGAFNQYFSSFESSKDINADQFISFLGKNSEESAVEYYDRLFSKGQPQSVLTLLTSPTKREFLNKTGLMMDDNLTDALDLVDEMQPRIARKIDFVREYEERKDKKINKDFDNDDDFSDEKEPSMRDLKNIEKMGNLDVDTDDDFLEEAELAKFTAKKGKNVDTENAKNEKEAEEMIKDAEKTQETTEEKVDNLKNQKHINSTREEEIALRQHGRNSMLDLDYGNDSQEDFKDRIEKEANGLPDKEGEANVDYDSKGGEKLMKAVKARRPERDMDYGSKGLNIDKDFAYERSDALKEAVDSQLDRMKKMFTYDQNIINEEKKVKQINENDIFWTSVSKKKLL